MRLLAVTIGFGLLAMVLQESYKEYSLNNGFFCAVSQKKNDEI